MSAINEGGPAFPVNPGLCDPTATQEQIRIAWGMSVRDYFAIHATHEDWKHYTYGRDRTLTPAEARFKFADAMLAERKAKS